MDDIVAYKSLNQSAEIIVTLCGFPCPTYYTAFPFILKMKCKLETWKDYVRCMGTDLPQLKLFLNASFVSIVSVVAFYSECSLDSSRAPFNPVQLKRNHGRVNYSHQHSTLQRGFHGFTLRLGQTQSVYSYSLAGDRKQQQFWRDLLQLLCILPRGDKKFRLIGQRERLKGIDWLVGQQLSFC